MFSCATQRTLTKRQTLLRASPHTHVWPQHLPASQEPLTLDYVDS